jgi:hypothetical protein
MRRPHHDTGQVGSDEPRATQVGVDELRSLQAVRAREGGHGFPYFAVTLVAARLRRRGTHVAETANTQLMAYRGCC